jgi:hypothetical protein
MEYFTLFGPRKTDQKKKYYLKQVIEISRYVKGGGQTAPPSSLIRIQCRHEFIWRNKKSRMK